MKKKEIKKAGKSLARAAAQTFSEMAFVDVTEALKVPEALEYSQIIHISLFEPMEGEIALFLPADCKRMIVENIYGSDWADLQAAEIDDCLLELLNVLAGNFLIEYCGTEVKHDISLPELLFNESELKNSYQDFYFDAEGVNLKISIKMKRPSL